MLRKVGFFQELKHGDKNYKSLKSSMQTQNIEYESEILHYLESGFKLCISPGLVHDVVSKDKEVIGSLSILTDGVWCWPSDLAYYVKKYHVTLEQDFILHMINSDWVIPDKNNFDFNSLMF